MPPICVFPAFGQKGAFLHPAPGVPNLAMYAVQSRTAYIAKKGPPGAGCKKAPFWPHQKAGPEKCLKAIAIWGCFAAPHLRFPAFGQKGDFLHPAPGGPN